MTLFHALHYNVSIGKNSLKKKIKPLTLFKRVTLWKLWVSITLFTTTQSLTFINKNKNQPILGPQLKSLSLILDDIIDKIETRRNKLCCYQLNYVQSVVVNDSVMLWSDVHFIINEYFCQLQRYVYIIVFLKESAFCYLVAMFHNLQWTHLNIWHSINRHTFFVLLYTF